MGRKCLRGRSPSEAVCCAAARQDVFEYIELINKPKRKHTNNGKLSPVDFEVRQQKLTEAGV